MWLGSALVWRSAKQSMVSQNTAEAELQAMVSGLQLGLAAKEVLDEMGLDNASLTVIGDNQAALALAKNGGAW